MQRRSTNRDVLADKDVDEEQCPVLADDFLADASPTAELIRRETRGARTVATIALALAAFATLCMFIVVFRVEHGLTKASPENSVGLGGIEVGAGFDEEDPHQAVEGWYRTYLNTAVRETPDLESKRLAVLSVGKEVYVVEKRGRRVRIETPVAGWMSMTTSDGVRILRRDISQAGASFNRSALNKVFQSQKVIDAATNARNTAAKFTELEQNLIDTLKLMNERIVHGSDRPFTMASQAAGKAITDTAHTVHNQVVDTSKTAVQAVQERSHDVEAVLNNKLKVQVPHGLSAFLGKM